MAKASLSWFVSMWRAVHVSAPALGVDAAEIQHVRGSMSFAPPNRASVAGLLILAIAEVFRVGTRLNEDQSLTI